MTFRLRLHGAVVGATACTVLLAGCSGSSGYFMVRDPGSATPYYTTNIDTEGSAVKFRDEKTGSAVTLQSSEVKKISKEDFTKGMTAPAPAPAAAPAAAAPAAVGTTAPAAVAVPAAAPQEKPQ